MNAYISLHQLLSDSSIQAKSSIDYIELEYQDINFRIYGVLHGLSGGTNQQYVKMVNNTIQDVKKAKEYDFVMAEKSMKKMYQGIDEELDDWLQIPAKDMVFLTLNLFALPTRFIKIFSSVIQEKLTRHDRFNHQGIRRIQDIGGSAFFHHLAPQQRRLIAGFPDAEKYLQVNLARRKHFFNTIIQAPRFPDKNWWWLNLIEPYVNIPARSIHMIEYAVLLAKKHQKKEVSLFIGEIHNSDIEWYVKHYKHHQDSYESSFNSDLEQITQKAFYYFSHPGKKLYKKICYLGLNAFTVIPCFALYLLLFDIVKHFIK
jgi:hypothetical protein